MIDKFYCFPEYSMMTECSPKGENFRESLEQSNNPELQKVRLI